MKKSLSVFFVFFVMAFFAFGQNISAQAPDLQSDVVVECVTFTPSKGYGRWPNNIEDGTFTGTCSGETKCDIVTCMPDVGCVPNTGFVRLNSGNNFFSRGVINEPGQLVDVQDHTGYYIYAAHTPEPLGTGSDEENTSQQLSEANLLFLGGVENCTQIFWDPYGRVFDSVSLEPFNTGEASVTLLDENGSPSLNTFTNNVLIDKMGKYNIRIKADGKYKLNVSPKTNHQFTANTPNAKYRNLYEFIYKLGDPAFVETAQNPKRVDVALDPIGNPYTRIPDFISREYLDVWFAGELYTKIALRTIHPKTIVRVMINGVELKEDGAGHPLPKTSDKEGYWLALIKKDVLSQEGFSIELIKNPQYYPLTKNNNNFLGRFIDNVLSLFVRRVSAQQSITIDDPIDPSPIKSSGTKVIRFEPILEYLEGYAYDKNNEIISQAKINVKLKMNNKIYSSTTADESGFFIMYPNKLPPYEYFLEFINPKTNQATVQTTSAFVGNNQAYLNLEKINLIQATKQGQKIINPETGKLNNLVTNNNPTQQISQSPSTTANKTVFNPAVLIIILIIILLIVVSFGLIFYIKQSRSI